MVIDLVDMDLVASAQVASLRVERRSPDLQNLACHGDGRGLLVAVEAGVDVPFPIERVDYIVPQDGFARGFHAHRELQQLMVCVAGSCRVVLEDVSGRREVVLDRPDRGLHIGPMAWHEMHDWGAGAIMLVLASHRYDEGDYIRNYDTFCALLAEAGR